MWIYIVCIVRAAPDRSCILWYCVHAALRSSQLVHTSSAVVSYWLQLCLAIHCIFATPVSHLRIAGKALVSTLSRAGYKIRCLLWLQDGAQRRNTTNWHRLKDLDVIQINVLEMVPRTLAAVRC